MEMNQREKALYEFIKGFMLKNGYTPSVRDMIEGLGVKSTKTAHELFTKLIQKGFIEKYGNRYRVRGIEYVEVSEVPSMGDDKDEVSD